MKSIFYIRIEYKLSNSNSKKIPLKASRIICTSKFLSGIRYSYKAELVLLITILEISF